MSNQIPTPAPYIRRFENLGFGMFVHFGLYAQMGRGEWIKCIAGIPTEEYNKLMDTFTACDFDARAMVKMAKAAGCKYIVLTTRHHDGFSLYDTCGLSDFDAPHSPAGRDLIREYVDACNEEGIIPFFYHTTLDWFVPEFNEDFPSYLEYLRRSVEILCTRYGKIGGLWFDGNWSKPNEDWKEDELYGTIRRHQPEAIIVNNSGIHLRGAYGHPEIDSVTFENGAAEPMDRTGKPKYVAGEMCQTINDHWGYGRGDFNCKSTAELIETLCHCRRVGANYLLNIGPTEQGGIEPLQKALMLTIGAWIDVFGEAIYLPKPAGISGEDKNFGLRNEETGTVYLFVHDLARTGDTNVTVPGGGKGDKCFTGVPAGVKRITWMDNGEELVFTQDGDTLSVNCTGAPYGFSFVVRVAKVEF